MKNKQKNEDINFLKSEVERSKNYFWKFPEKLHP